LIGLEFETMRLYGRSFKTVVLSLPHIESD